MQLDVGSEPYLSTGQALCLFISHIFYYKSFENWQRVTAMANSESLTFGLETEHLFYKRPYFLVCFSSKYTETDRWIKAKFHYTSCNTFRDMNYFLLFLVQSGQTDGQTDRQKVMHRSPPCNLHRWAQK